jgi:hypothetical protein
MVVWLNGGQQGVRSVSERGLTFVQSGEVYVPRDYDLLAGDRIPWGGAHFHVIGLAQADQLHVFTGDNFGWKFFQIEGGR